ncbi:MAG: PepSY-associated TM helix domain-containing protein [Pseudomonadota bacterium]
MSKPPAKPLLRWARRLHMWTGIVIVLPLFAIIVSGTVLVVDQQIIGLRAPELFKTKLPMSLEAKGDDLATIDRLAGEVGWNLTRLPQVDRPYYDVWLMDDRRAYLVPGADTFSDVFHWHQRPETFFFELHAHLVSGDFGETLVGVIGIAAFAIVIGGIFIWWPSRRGWSLQRLKLKGPDRRTLLRAHGAWGALLAVPLGFLFFTGIGTAFPDQTRSVLGSIAGGGAPARTDVGVPAFPDNRPDWAAVLAVAEAAFDDDSIVFLFTPAPGEDGAIYMRTRRAKEWHPNGRSEIYIDAAKGELLAKRDLTQADPGLQVANGFYPTHATRGGAWWLAPLALTTGLAAIALLWAALSALTKRWMRR